MREAAFPSEMTLRHAAVLARLTALGLALAERVQAEAMAAAAVEDLDRLSQAFHRTARGVRMSMALEAKLARAEREEARAAARADNPSGLPELPERRLVPVFIRPDGSRSDPAPAAAPKAESLAEREPEDWPEEGDETPAERKGRARPLAAEAEAYAARVAHVRGELAAEFGPAYAEAHAETLVAEAIFEERQRRAGARAPDTS